jgi:deoxyribonuclease-1
MMFDLHNLAPSIGSVNGRRSNHRYGELPDDASDFGQCEIEDANRMFEPPACARGDVARVWFYMNLVHGVEITAEERGMFERWSINDPVSPWESERERRIAAYSRVNNPFVDGVSPSEVGACPWEPSGAE